MSRPESIYAATERRAPVERDRAGMKERRAFRLLQRSSTYACHPGFRPFTPFLIRPRAMPFLPLPCPFCAAYGRAKHLVLSPRRPPPAARARASTARRQEGVAVARPPASCCCAVVCACLFLSAFASLCSFAYCSPAIPFLLSSPSERTQYTPQYMRDIDDTRPFTSFPRLVDIPALLKDVMAPT